MALKFEVRHFVQETDPAYSDPEGDSPFRLEITSLPIFGLLVKEGVPVVDNARMPISDAAKLEYLRDENKREAHTDYFNFRIADIGSERFSNIGTITINAKGLPNAPTVDDNSAILTSRRYDFKETDFIKNFADIDGDSYSIVTIKSLPAIPALRFEGAPVYVGLTFDVSESSDLSYTLPSNYSIYNGVIYEFDKPLETIIFEAENAGYKLIANEDGVLTFGKSGKEYDTVVVRGIALDNEALCFDFTTSDDSASLLPSNEAEFCLITEGDVNVIPPYVNQPPTVGDSYFTIDHAGEIYFVYSDFITGTTPPYNDIEGDLPVLLKLEYLPSSGSLTFKGNPMTVDQEISVSDIGFIKYEADELNDTEHSLDFGFRISDSGSNAFSNLGTININVLEKVASPPTVEDSQAPLTDNEYTFSTLEFTTNFQDPDNDGYEITRIESLPTIGTLTYNGTPVTVGFEFPTANSGSLVYTLPDNIVISPTGYCSFDEPVDDIVADQNADGFTLVNQGIGFLEFEKALTSEIPNDTDIYAIFDTTSMLLSNGQAASAVLKSWHAQYKADTPLYTGNLYIIPLNYEHWVDYQDVLIIGSGVSKASNNGNPAANSANVLQEWKDIALYPTNFNHSTNDPLPNTAWTAPTKVLLLAFVDEVENDGYHPNRNGYGLNHRDFQPRKQPTDRYLDDYKRFRDNLDNHWEFFRGVFYPIPDIDFGSYNNVGNACVLQGFAAIEGGATYTLPEITALGVTYASERRFHWHLDPNNPSYTGLHPTIANPYSPEANTPVPNAPYNLQGLKDFGWYGVYNKDQPASAVFSSNSFSDELSEFLKGDSTSTVEKRVIEGDCVDDVSICFDFRTSDDSEFTLFSNVASVCLTPSIDGLPPTVSDNSAPLRIRTYSFNTGSFTKNFSDPDGDSYRTITLKSLPNIEGLKLLGSPAQIGDTFLATNSNNLVYELSDRYAVYAGVVYDFGKSIDTIISEYEGLGYSLTDNRNGTLTFVQDNNDSNVSTVKGTIVFNSNLCFNFTTSDNSPLNLNSNVAKFCLIPEGDINIKVVEVNDPPVIGDNRIRVRNNEVRTFTQAHFVEDTTPPYYDPQTDAPYELKVLTLPQYGELLYNGAPVSINQIISFVDIRAGQFKYAADASRTDVIYTSFEFAVSDIGSKRFTE